MKWDFQTLVNTLRNARTFGERARAAETLAQAGHPQAVQPLIEALRDDYATVRTAVAMALAKIGDVRAVHPLGEALRKKDDPDTPLDGDARAAAALALGQIGDECAARFLASALRDSQAKVREAAAEALDLLNWKPITSTDLARYLLAKGEDPATACATDPGLLDAVVDALVRGEGSGRLGSVKILGKLRHSSIVPYLISMLSEGDSEVRAAAIEALKNSMDARAILPLVERLGDCGYPRAEDRENRAIAEALQELLPRVPAEGLGSLVDVLIHKLGEVRDAGVRVSVAGLLAQTGDVAGIDPLVSALEKMTVERGNIRNAGHLAYSLERLLQVVRHETRPASLERIAALKSQSETTTVIPMYGSGGEPWQEADTCEVTALKAIAEQELQHRSHAQQEAAED